MGPMTANPSSPYAAMPECWVGRPNENHSSDHPDENQHRPYYVNMTPIKKRCDEFVEKDFQRPGDRA